MANLQSAWLGWRGLYGTAHARPFANGLVPGKSVGTGLASWVDVKIGLAAAVGIAILLTTKATQLPVPQ